MDQYFECDFNEIKKEIITKHLSDTEGKKLGIPQGTPLSGVLANVYMIEFDKNLKQFASERGGIYRRYSDDFIIVLDNEEDIESTVEKMINGNIELDGFLKISQEKTKRYKWENSIFIELIDGVPNKFPTEIEYLGFRFDGKKSRLRNSTVSKFYRKMHSFIKKEIMITTKVRIKDPKYKRSKRKAFLKYSVEGSNITKNKDGSIKTYGNFMTYVDRCNGIMGSMFDDQDITMKVKKRIPVIYERKR